jgi:hypothetical protein
MPNDRLLVRPQLFDMLGLFMGATLPPGLLEEGSHKQAKRVCGLRVKSIGTGYRFVYCVG